MEASEVGESFSWRVRLLDSEPKKAVGIFACAVFAALLGGVVFHSLMLAIVGTAIIFGSTAEYWLGSSFVIDRKGVRSRTGFSLTVIEWEQVKRIFPEGNGLRISPLEKAGTLDAFRGVLLRFQPDRRKSVEEAIAKFGGLHGHSLFEPDRGGDRADGG